MNAVFVATNMLQFLQLLIEFANRFAFIVITSQLDHLQNHNSIETQNIRILDVSLQDCFRN